MTFQSGWGHFQAVQKEKIYIYTLNLKRGNDESDKIWKYVSTRCKVQMVKL